MLDDLALRSTLHIVDFDCSLGTLDPQRIWLLAIAFRFLSPLCKSIDPSLTSGDGIALLCVILYLFREFAPINLGLFDLKMCAPLMFCELYEVDLTISFPIIVFDQACGIGRTEVWRRGERLIHLDAWLIAEAFRSSAHYIKSQGIRP